MGNVHYVGAEPLTFERIEEILTGNMKLELTPEVKERIQRCRDYLDRKIETQSEPLYGITTGFGSLCNKNISPDELSTLQENLVKSHACSVGDEVSPVIVRLMMLLKAHALSLGHSGVQVITVQRILDFFNNDVLPIVYDRGSLGASGDLAPLANLFLPLIGVGDVYYKGKKREAISVLDEFAWVARAEEYDNYILDCVAAKNTANIVKMHEKHAAIAEQMLRKATHRLLTLADEDVDANAVVRMVDIGVKVERLSRGEPTENRTVTHGGALEVESTQRADLSDLSDEELSQLAGLLEKSSPG